MTELYLSFIAQLMALTVEMLSSARSLSHEMVSVQRQAERLDVLVSLLGTLTAMRGRDPLDSDKHAL